MSSNCLFELPYSSGHLIAWVNRRHLETLPPVSRAKWRLRNERRNCILMTRHYRDLGSASGWLNQISHAARPVRSTTQIWVVTRHQYGISVLVSQTSFGGKLPVVASPNVGCFLRLVIWQWSEHPVYQSDSSTKEIQYCLGIWILCHRFRIPGLYSRIFCQWNLDSGLQSIVGFRIP